ncbi:MAG: aquaporin [Planctomycetota bacterium]|nr:aquaporin [Planctomycetota bacterium]
MSQSPKSPTLFQHVAAEVVGTFLLVFFGCGVVHTAVLMDAQQGLWQVAVVWGVAIMLAIYTVGGISGAQLNPAMTIAMAVLREFPKNRVVAYIVGQLLGAFLAAGLLFTLFHPQLAAKEQAKGVRRGEAGSEITAMCYGEFSPNPGSLAAGSEKYAVADHETLKARVPPWLAFVAELFGTAILACVVFAVTDSKNRGGPAVGQAAIFIGLTVAALISVIAPLTQACFNPARDFGPRLFSAIAGWGSIALPLGTDWNWLTVYIIAPIFGALVGGLLYEKILGPAHRAGVAA